MLLALTLPQAALAQGSLTFRYFYDDIGRLVKVLDSTGVVIDYVYDPVGNILQIRRSTLASPSAPAFFNLTPQQGGVGTMVTIEGQGFSPTPSGNTVRFNGVQALLLSATSTTLVVVVPVGATTGPITVTVGGTTLTSSTNFTVIPLAPQDTPPTVTILSPASGATLLQGQPITIAVNASGTSAVVAVDISMNGAFFITNVPPPFARTFTVPFSVSTITFGARARDVNGNTGFATPVTVSVIADPFTTVQGTVNNQGVAVAGANVAVKVNGLKGEFFGFGGPLAAFPDLTGRTPDVVKLVSAIDFRNPNSLFGADTFGVALGPNFAARFTGLLRLAAPGIYTFTLGADDGARLLINGALVAEVSAAGRFAEASGTVNMPAGSSPIEIQYFQSGGSAELQLSFRSVTGTKGERLPVPTSALAQSQDQFTALTGATGAFSIAGVPAALGNLRAQATATVSGQARTGQSAEAAPVGGGVTELGAVNLRKILFTSLSAGGSHVCGVTTTGAAYCWGRGSVGQLGNGLVNTSSSRPVAVLGGLTFASISAGGSEHTCGVTTTGAAYCWGSNAFGQFGNGTTTGSATPVLVSGGLSWASVSAGGNFSCGLTTGGAAYCWGDNSSGRLGNGSFASSSTPAPVAGGLSWSSVSAGPFGHACGVTSGAGAAYCWGSIMASNIPLAIAGGLTFASASAGFDQACGLTTAQSAFCWGSNSAGQLGNGTTTGGLNPVAVSGGLAFAAVSAGSPSGFVGGTFSHSCGVTTGGAGYCWGDNALGELGNGTSTRSTVPVAVSGGLSFASLSAGGAFSCGITTGGEAYCWGVNAPSGQLGAGLSVFAVNAPVAVLDPQ